MNIINKQKKFSVSDINKILNVFLKIMRKSFTEVITALTQTCWQLIYYFKHFHWVRTIAFYKIKKNFYINSCFWRSIVLLNTVRKIIKTITAKQIQKMIEKHNMLFIHQISTHQKWSTKTVLNLLVNQIHGIYYCF